MTVPVLRYPHSPSGSHATQSSGCDGTPSPSASVHASRRHSDLLPTYQQSSEPTTCTSLLVPLSHQERESIGSTRAHCTTGYSRRPIYHPFQAYEELPDLPGIVPNHFDDDDCYPSMQSPPAYSSKSPLLFELNPKLLLENVELSDETLGTGSYGEVRLATCNSLQVAAKSMHSVLKGSSRSSRQFENEIETLSSIRHPNIVNFMGVYQKSNDYPYIIMELVEGGSLHQFVDSLHGESRIVSLRQKVRIILDVSLALEYLHSKHIIHRDLSSSNVLLTTDLRAKVSDFGMSRLFSVPSMQPCTLAPGCPSYMPPEALTEGNWFSQKGDVFSYGVIVIELITEEHPRPLSTDKNEPNRRMRDCRDFAQKAPETLRSLTMPCLQHDHNKRPTAKDLNVELKDYLESLGKETSELMVGLGTEQSSQESDQRQSLSPLIHCGSQGPVLCPLQTSSRDTSEPETQTTQEDGRSLQYTEQLDFILHATTEESQNNRSELVTGCSKSQNSSCTRYGIVSDSESITHKEGEGSDNEETSKSKTDFTPPKRESKVPLHENACNHSPYSKANVPHTTPHDPLPNNETSEHLTAVLYNQFMHDGNAVCALMEGSMQYITEYTVPNTSYSTVVPYSLFSISPCSHSFSIKSIKVPFPRFHGIPYSGLHKRYYLPFGYIDVRYTVSGNVAIAHIFIPGFNRQISMHFPLTKKELHEICKEHIRFSSGGISDSDLCMTKCVIARSRVPQKYTRLDACTMIDFISNAMHFICCMLKRTYISDGSCALSVTPSKKSNSGTAYNAALVKHDDLLRKIQYNKYLYLSLTTFLPVPTVSLLHLDARTIRLEQTKSDYKPCFHDTWRRLCEAGIAVTRTFSPVPNNVQPQEMSTATSFSSDGCYTLDFSHYTHTDVGTASPQLHYLNNPTDLWLCVSDHLLQPLESSHKVLPPVAFPIPQQTLSAKICDIHQLQYNVHIMAVSLPNNTKIVQHKTSNCFLKTSFSCECTQTTKSLINTPQYVCTVSQVRRLGRAYIDIQDWQAFCYYSIYQTNCNWLEGSVTMMTVRLNTPATIKMILHKHNQLLITLVETQSETSIPMPENIPVFMATIMEYPEPQNCLMLSNETKDILPKNEHFCSHALTNIARVNQALSSTQPKKTQCMRDLSHTQPSRCHSTKQPEMIKPQHSHFLSCASHSKITVKMKCKQNRKRRKRCSRDSPTTTGKKRRIQSDGYDRQGGVSRKRINSKKVQILQTKKTRCSRDPLGTTSKKRKSHDVGYDRWNSVGRRRNSSRQVKIYKTKRKRTRKKRKYSTDYDTILCDTACIRFSTTKAMRWYINKTKRKKHVRMMTKMCGESRRIRVRCWMVKKWPARTKYIKNLPQILPLDLNQPVRVMCTPQSGSSNTASGGSSNAASSGKGSSGNPCDRGGTGNHASPGSAGNGKRRDDDDNDGNRDKKPRPDKDVDPMSDYESSDSEEDDNWPYQGKTGPKPESTLQFQVPPKGKESGTESDGKEKRTQYNSLPPQSYDGLNSEHLHGTKHPMGSQLHLPKGTNKSSQAETKPSLNDGEFSLPKPFVTVTDIDHDIDTSTFDDLASAPIEETSTPESKSDSVLGNYLTLKSYDDLEVVTGFLPLNSNYLLLCSLTSNHRDNEDSDEYDALEQQEEQLNEDLEDNQQGSQDISNHHDNEDSDGSVYYDALEQQEEQLNYEQDFDQQGSQDVTIEVGDGGHESDDHRWEAAEEYTEDDRSHLVEVNNDHRDNDLEEAEEESEFTNSAETVPTLVSIRPSKLDTQLSNVATVCVPTQDEIEMMTPHDAALLGHHYQPFSCCMGPDNVHPGSLCTDPVQERPVMTRLYEELRQVGIHSQSFCDQGTLLEAYLQWTIRNDYSTFAAEVLLHIVNSLEICHRWNIPFELHCSHIFVDVDTHELIVNATRCVESPLEDGTPQIECMKRSIERFSLLLCRLQMRCPHDSDIQDLIRRLIRIITSVDSYSNMFDLLQTELHRHL